MTALAKHHNLTTLRIADPTHRDKDKTFTGNMFGACTSLQTIWSGNGPQDVVRFTRDSLSVWRADLMPAPFHPENLWRQV